MGDVLDTWRRRAQDELRSRVAGPDGVARRAEIFDVEGPRRFDPDDPIWRVHADAAMFIGGLRAILLQSLHPVAMHAVAEHSGYRGDPWGRLQRTADFLAATTFGTESVASSAAAQVRAVHRHVHGELPDGTAYHAGDPHLLEWVHVAEVASFLNAHDCFGQQPLTPDEADRYVEQVGQIGLDLGAVDVPRSRFELRQRLREFRPELAPTPAALDAARFLLVEPPIAGPARAAYGALAAAAATSLPGWARRALRIPSLPFDRVVLGRPAGHAVTAALRWITA